jgi:parallel beta-helix repeat protein
MTSATMLSVLQIGEQSQVRASGCCIHGGQGGGVFIHEGKAILENNDIHSNVEAGVKVTEGEAVLVNNTIRDGHKCGVIICDSSKATLMNNTIVNNDQDGIILQEQASAALAGNTIKGNGLCKVVWTEEDFEARWDEDDIAHYREVHSANGYPGVRVLENSIVNMVGGSNSIEGNGRAANAEQVCVDGSSKAGSEWSQSFDGPDGLHIRECVLALDTLI